jgi:peptidoglycan/LPS O-acetylase OafA/YrhL
MLIALAFRSRFRLPAWLAGSILLVAILAFAVPDRWSELPGIPKWGVLSALIVGALALAQSTTKPGPMWRVLSFLGDASYSLYLVHPIAITLPRRIFPHFINPAASPWLYAALLLATALGAAALVHLLFERPVTRFLQRGIARRFHGAARDESASDLKPVSEVQVKIGR